jgi:chromosome transmission fidelity protein 1
MNARVDVDAVDAYPRGSLVPFPRTPYPQQVMLMDTLLQAIKETSEFTKILLLESPTGTGKSLSLACASLAWLEHQLLNNKNQDEIKPEATPSKSKSPTSTTSTTTGLDWIDDWQPADLSKNAVKNEEMERIEKVDETLQNLRTLYQKSTRLHRAKQDITKARIQYRKRQRLQKRRKEQLEFEDEDEHELSGSRRPHHPKGSLSWMLQTHSNTSDTATDTDSIKAKIIYAARTHSQLSQFVSEVRKTKWGGTTKVISLASRSQGLCGYLSGNNNNESNLTEACIELRQSKKRIPGSISGCACPFYHKDSIEMLALHSLAEPTDVEDWKALGEATQTCAYYASRQALPHADLVVLPYSLLVCKETRESIGLSLENSLVLVDEGKLRQQT